MFQRPIDSSRIFRQVIPQPLRRRRVVLVTTSDLPSRTDERQDFALPRESPLDLWSFGLGLNRPHQPLPDEPTETSHAIEA